MGATGPECAGLGESGARGEKIGRSGLARDVDLSTRSLVWHKRTGSRLRDRLTPAEALASAFVLSPTARDHITQIRDMVLTRHDLLNEGIGQVDEGFGV